MARSQYDLLLDELDKADRQRRERPLSKADSITLRAVRPSSSRQLTAPGSVRHAVARPIPLAPIAAPVSAVDRFNSLAGPFMTKAMAAFNSGRITALDVAKLEARMHRIAAQVR